MNWEDYRKSWKFTIEDCTRCGGSGAREDEWVCLECYGSGIGNMKDADEKQKNIDRVTEEYNEYRKNLKNSKKEYEVGDTLYFAMGLDHLVEGKVIHKFVYCGSTMYVLEYNAIVDCDYVVREWETVSETPTGHLNMYRGILP